MPPQRQTTGLVLGKFLPPHQGHVYLIEFANRYVDQLTVVVDSLDSQPIPGDLRAQWLRDMFPGVRVVQTAGENPQDPSEHPEFWKIWRESLGQALGGQVDYLFASESYGVRLAHELQATFVPVDISRTAIPISGTAIRESPLEHWQFLPRIVRPYFAKRICIFGPESTGKSTLARDLAIHFNTVVVPEYARGHIEYRGGQVSLEDMIPIARGQIASEEALALDANRLLICDTDVLTTTIWSHWLFRSCPEWIQEQADRRDYTLYLVTDVDVPWVADQVRFLPEERRTFFDRCIEELERRRRNYHIVRGTWEERFQSAVQAIVRSMS